MVYPPPGRLGDISPLSGGYVGCCTGRCKGRGNLPTTWRRELREELGGTLDPACIMSLRYGTYADGTRWHDFDYEWPSLPRSGW